MSTRSRLHFSVSRKFKKKKIKNVRGREENEKEIPPSSIFYAHYTRYGLCMLPRRYLWCCAPVYACGQLKTLWQQCVWAQFISKTEKWKRNLLRSLKTLLLIFMFVLQDILKQRAKKVMSDSLGLVDFAIGLVNSVLNLPDRQAKIFREIKITKVL